MPLPSLNAVQLRRLADAAASIRAPGGDPLYAVSTEDNGSDTITIELGSAHHLPPVGSMIEFDTKDQQPDRPPARVTIQGGDMSGPSTLDQYDAVFWSEAAVEKFVVPYYASKSLWMAAHVLQGLAKAWYGFVPGTDDDSDIVVDANEIPFAVAHLPGSDYVPLSDAAAPGDDLFVLIKKQDGTIEHRALTHYLAAPQPA
jgi:hypothetical protein